MSETRGRWKIDRRAPEFRYGANHAGFSRHRCMDPPPSSTRVEPRSEGLEHTAHLVALLKSHHREARGRSPGRLSLGYSGARGMEVYLPQNRLSLIVSS